MLAFETEDVLQAWALPMENIIGVGGFVLALATVPLTSGLGREGLLECRTSSVPPERLRLSLTEATSEIEIEEGDVRGCWLVERLGDAWKASLIGVSFRRRVSISRVPCRVALAARSLSNSFPNV